MQTSVCMYLSERARARVCVIFRDVTASVIINAAACFIYLFILLLIIYYYYYYFSLSIRVIISHALWSHK